MSWLEMKDSLQLIEGERESNYSRTNVIWIKDFGFMLFLEGQAIGGVQNE